MFGKSGNGRPVVSVAAMLFAASDFPLSGFPAKSAILLSGMRFSQSHFSRCGLMELAVRTIPLTTTGSVVLELAVLLWDDFSLMAATSEPPPRLPFSLTIFVQI